MGFAVGWIAVALAGMADTPPKEPAGAPILYTVRMVETQGMGWREGVMTHLKPVTRQGATTVWTMPTHAMTRLVKDLQKDPASQLIQSPRVTALSGSPATIQCRENRQLITQVSWNGDEIAPQGAPEKVRLGWHTTVVGRRLDQGVLVKLVFEDTQIRAIHQVKLNRSCASHCEKSSLPTVSQSHVFKGAGNVVAFVAIPLAGKSPFEVSASKEGCEDEGDCCPSAEVGQKDASVQTVMLEVPEIASQEVAGEWLIPNGEHLLLSFGAYTVAGKDGKAVVKERLAIVGAEEAVGAGAIPAAAVPTWVPNLHAAPVAPTADLWMGDILMKELQSRTFKDLARERLQMSQIPVAESGPPVGPAAVPVAPAAKIPPPMPALPGRSLPQGYHSDGTKADLPPLPADETDADSAASESSEPLASPQSKKPQPPKPPTDAGTTKTSLPDPKKSDNQRPGASFANPFDGIQFLIPIKSMSIQLPFNQKLDIEIRGRVAGAMPPSWDNLMKAAYELVEDSNALRKAGEEWERFWLFDQAAPMAPLAVPGEAKP